MPRGIKGSRREEINHREDSERQNNQRAKNTKRANKGLEARVSNKIVAHFKYRIQLAPSLHLQLQAGELQNECSYERDVLRRRGNTTRIKQGMGRRECEGLAHGDRDKRQILGDFR